MGWSEVVVSAETRSLIGQAEKEATPLWLVLQAGVRQPRAYWTEILLRSEDQSDFEVVNLDRFDRIFDRGGTATPKTLEPDDSGVAPELLVRLD